VAEGRDGSSPLIRTRYNKNNYLGTITRVLFGVFLQAQNGKVDATSLFDAAATVTQDWSRLWWWSSSSLIEVESGTDRWQVNQATVRKWRKTKAIPEPEPLNAVNGDPELLNLAFVMTRQTIQARFRLASQRPLSHAQNRTYMVTGAFNDTTASPARRIFSMLPIVLPIAVSITWLPIWIAWAVLVGGAGFTIRRGAR
jgi:hypothetical protein